MALYNAKKIQEKISCMETVERLGLKTRIVAGRMWAICPNPGHNDRRTGSCIADEKGIHCFACGFHEKNPIKIVMAARGCKFVDACEFLVGNDKDFMVDENSEEAMRPTIYLPYSQDDLDLLGLKRAVYCKCPKNLSIYKPNNPMTVKKSSYYTAENGNIILNDELVGDTLYEVYDTWQETLLELYENNVAEFYELILRKLDEVEHSCNVVLNSGMLKFLKLPMEKIYVIETQLKLNLKRINILREKTRETISELTNELMQEHLDFLSTLQDVDLSEYKVVEKNPPIV